VEAFHFHTFACYFKAMTDSLFLIIFIVVIAAILLFDLGVFNRESHIVKFKEALIWTVIWVSLSLGFFAFLKVKGEFIYGSFQDKTQIEHAAKYHPEVFKPYLPLLEAGQELDAEQQDALESSFRKEISLQYITGYLIEYSLSVDNVFVILLIFIGFGVRQKHYKWILFWGVMGAVVMRFIFIFLGAALIHRFEWILYLFGGFLVVTGVIMFRNRNKHERIDPHHHPVVKLASRFFRLYPRNVGHRFFVRKRTPKGMKWFVTPLFLVLMVVEFSDLIFAVDSIPAIFGITRDPYIVFFSNIFAIIGLRSLFFLIAGLVEKLVYLKTGLAVLLTFIGVKMLLHHPYIHIEIPVQTSLFIVLGILAVSIIASLIFPPKHKPELG
jgi:tellurite resistance protein TerC